MSPGAFRSPRAALRAGLVEGLFGPGLGTFAAMLGFGSLAGDAGLPLWVTLAVTAGLWSMPGQVAFVDLHASGAPLLLLTLVVALANVRVFPLTIATIPLIRAARGVRPFHFLLAQLNSVTNYARIAEVSLSERDPVHRLRFFVGFSAGTFVAGVAGAFIGLRLAGALPLPAVKALVFVTPLYLLLLTMRNPRPQVRIAVVAGCVLVPLLFELMGNAGVLIGGLAGGTLAFGIVARGRRRE